MRLQRRTPSWPPRWFPALASGRSKCAGNFGVPAVTTDPEKFKELQMAELKNGRLAMIGIISFACAVGIPGSVPLYPF